MTLLDTLRARRAVKAYDPEHRLSEDELRTLITAAALAPSSFNQQNRHFVAVTDPEVKAKLQPVAYGQQQVHDASVVFVLTGDMSAYRNTDRYLRNAPAAAQESLKRSILGIYDGNERMLRDEACRSVGLSAMALMLMARDMGYESGPMIGFDPAGVSEVLGLPDDRPPLMFVVVGKGTKEPHGRLGLLDFDEVASIDRHGNHALKGEIPG